jgi:hypothetical protein
VTVRIDSTILHEIARVIEARSKVPDSVRIQGKSYQISYLEDHKQRLEEAIRRRDVDRLGMLFGQLPSKVKYQLVRQASRRKKAAPARTRRTRSTKTRTTRRRAARS